MAMYKIRLNLELNPGLDQVYTVTSPDVSELITEGGTPEEILKNVQEVIADLLEIWASEGTLPPLALQHPTTRDQIDLLVAHEISPNKLLISSGYD